MTARTRTTALLFIATLACPAMATVAAEPIVPPSLRFDGAAPGSHTAAAIAGAGDVNGDGEPDVIVGGPLGTGTPPSCAGAAHVLFGPFVPGTLDLHLPLRGLTITGARCRDLAGTSVAAAGDVNGDGLGDVVIGAPAGGPDDEGVATQPGRAYVVFGRRNGAMIDLGRLGDGGFVIEGRSRQITEALGWSVAGAGDVNGDGRDDVIVAAPGNQGFERSFTKGAAYVILGRRSTRTVRIARLKRGFRIGTSAPGGLRSVAGAGDVDGDGLDDVVVGDVSGARRRGAAHVILGSRHPRRIRLDRLGRRGFTISGRDRAAETGYAVAGGGDVDGDGRDDVLVTAPQGNRAGSGAAGGAFVVFGRRAAADVDLRALGSRGIEIRGGPRDWAGFAIASAGRVNGDRLDDVVLTARGSLVVLFGRRRGGTVRMESLTSPAGFVIDGTIEPNQWYSDRGSGGFITAGALGGDADGDGSDDVLAGVRMADHNDRPDSGSGYLFFSP